MLLGIESAVGKNPPMHGRLRRCRAVTAGARDSAIGGAGLSRIGVELRNFIIAGQLGGHYE